MNHAIPQDPGGQVQLELSHRVGDLLDACDLFAGPERELVLSAASKARPGSHFYLFEATTAELAESLDVTPRSIRRYHQALRTRALTWLELRPTSRGVAYFFDLDAAVTPDTEMTDPGQRGDRPRTGPGQTPPDEGETDPGQTPDKGVTGKDAPSCARASSETSFLQKEEKQPHAASAAAADSSSGSDLVVDEEDDAAVLTRDIVEQLKRHGYEPDPIVVSRCVVPDLFATGIDLAGARSYAAKKLDGLIKRGPDRYDRWMLDQLFQYLAEDCAEWWLSEQSRRARVQATPRQPEHARLSSRPDLPPKPAGFSLDYWAAINNISLEELAEVQS